MNEGTPTLIHEIARDVVELEERENLGRLRANN